jgi:RNA polymerase sigma-70 factor (ECF subfamily)
MTTNDDETLIRQAQNDPQAFACLYDRYVDRIYTYVLRRTNDDAVAQDVTSATFEKALRHLRQFRWQGKSVCAWLYRIARNEAISIHRKQKFLTALSIGHPFSQQTEQEIENRQQVNELQRGLNRLSETDREVLMLRFYEGLSNEDVATILRCSVNTLYARTHRALGRLKKEVEDKHGASGEALEGE